MGIEINQRGNPELTTAIRTLPDPAIAAISDEIRVPDAAIQDPVIGEELRLGEDINAEAWLTPILTEQDVIEIGCDVGRRTAYLSQVAKRIVCTDAEPKRRILAEQTITMNRVGNAVVVDELDADDLSRGDVLLLNSRRPICEKHIKAIVKRPTRVIVVLGPLSKELARDILGAGYDHCSEFSRGAVFCVQVN